MHHDDRDRPAVVILAAHAAVGSLPAWVLLRNRRSTLTCITGRGTRGSSFPDGGLSLSLARLRWQLRPISW
jgi:hypothetical protein